MRIKLGDTLSGNGCRCNINGILRYNDIFFLYLVNLGNRAGILILAFY